MIVEPILLKELEYNMLGIRFNLKFDSNTILIIGEAGTGKSFLVDTLSDMCVEYPFIEILNYRYINKNVNNIIRSNSGKMFVIDNADILLGVEERKHIAFDITNQYVIIGRDPIGLMLVKDNIKEIRFENKEFCLVNAF